MLQTTLIIFINEDVAKEYNTRDRSSSSEERVALPDNVFGAEGFIRRDRWWKKMRQDQSKGQRQSE